MVAHCQKEEAIGNEIVLVKVGKTSFLMEGVLMDLCSNNQQAGRAPPLGCLTLRIRKPSWPQPPFLRYECESHRVFSWSSR
ncbi:hypothetical protein HAP32_04506 [Serratia fonticola]|nr:hypothetical protein HAP32_04506 [Serratia fonticola]